MEIHIFLAGVQIGPFSEKQVRRYLVDGLVSLSDPARLEGVENWETVEAVLASLPLADPVEIPTEPDPPPESAPRLISSASPKTKRKPAKIVIKPILPQAEATSPAPPAISPAPGKTTPVKTLTSSRLVPMAKVHAPRPPPMPKGKTKTSPATPFSHMQPGVIYASAGLASLLIILPICAFFFTGSSSQKAGQDGVSNQPKNASDTSANHDEQILAGNPQTAVDYTNRGLVRQSRGNLDGALADYDQAILLDPKYVQASYQRGLARQSKNDWKGALADFNQVLSLNPRHADAFSQRGFVKQSTGDPDGAIADYTRALLIDPKIAAAYYNRGLIKDQRGNFEGAILDYNQALDLDPNMAVAYYNRGVAKNSEGNLDGAIADYTQALAINPKIAVAYHDRGFARQSKGDLDGALGDYTQALALNPKIAAAYYNRGLIKEQKNDLDGAIADSTRALELNPKYVQSYCNRGLARLGKGDLDGAAGDLKTFCELAPRDNDADDAHLYLWLISTEENPRGHANQELADALLNDWNSTPEDLPSKIARFLLGHLTEKDLIAAADASDPGLDQGQHCKAWYFVGMKHLLAGDKVGAIDDFGKSLATEKKDLCEYIFAQAKLEELKQDSSAPSN